MRQAWKSPTSLRLKKIEAWLKNRIETAKSGRDHAKGFRAIDRYMAVATRSQGPLGMVSNYSDRD